MLRLQQNLTTWIAHGLSARNREFQREGWEAEAPGPEFSIAFVFMLAVLGLTINLFWR